MNDYQMVEYLQKFGLSNGTTLGHHSGAMDLIADRFVELLNKTDRQQAEIKTLRMDNNQLQDDIVNANCNYEQLKDDCELLKTALAQKVVSEIKSEAIKEFGKLLIDNSQNGRISACDILDYVVEMVGESNG